MPLSFYAPFRLCLFPFMPLSGLANTQLCQIPFCLLPFLSLSFLLISVYAPFRYGKYAILPNSFLPFSVYAPFRFGKYLIMTNSFLPLSFMPLSFMPLSFMLLSVYAPFRVCPFSFKPLSGLMEIIYSAGFLYANFRRPLRVREEATKLKPDNKRTKGGKRKNWRESGELDQTQKPRSAHSCLRNTRKIIYLLRHVTLICSVTLFHRMTHLQLFFLCLFSFPNALPSPLDNTFSRRVCQSSHRGQQERNNVI
jgi:hypothetical protein